VELPVFSNPDATDRLKKCGAMQRLWAAPYAIEVRTMKEPG